MTTEAAALERYNHLFDNRQYRAIVERIAADLRGEHEASVDVDD